jgi:predicted SAM-dependent methyltransferase
MGLSGSASTSIRTLVHGTRLRRDVARQTAEGESLKVVKITTRVAYAIFPPAVWSTLQFEARLTKCRWFNFLSPRRRSRISQLKRRGASKIHLGCGSRIFPGWLNVDGSAGEGVDLQWDLRRPLPLPDASSGMIYGEHILEHLCKDDAIRLLRECYRVLEPGGVLRVGVPDAALYLKAYVEGNHQWFKQMERLGGAVKVLDTPIDVINQMFRMGGHHLFAWDFHTLRFCLDECGFVEITRWEPAHASSVEISLDDPEHAFETLYVEARRQQLGQVHPQAR